MVEDYMVNIGKNKKENKLLNFNDFLCVKNALRVFANQPTVHSEGVTRVRGRGCWH